MGKFVPFSGFTNPNGDLNAEGGSAILGAVASSAGDFLALSQNDSKYKAGATGKAIGGAAGAGIGSIFGPAGTAIGGALGGLAGGLIGGAVDKGHMREDYDDKTSKHFSELNLMPNINPYGSYMKQGGMVTEAEPYNGDVLLHYINQDKELNLKATPQYDIDMSDAVVAAFAKCGMRVKSRRMRMGGLILPDSYQGGGEVTPAPFMQAGGRAPIYVDDPNDPRLQSYNDSLQLHTLSKQQQDALPFASAKLNPRYVSKVVGYNTPLGRAKGSQSNVTKISQISPNVRLMQYDTEVPYKVPVTGDYVHPTIKPSGFYNGGMGNKENTIMQTMGNIFSLGMYQPEDVNHQSVNYIYDKPVQPVELRTPPAAKMKRSVSDIKRTTPKQLIKPTYADSLALYNKGEKMMKLHKQSRGIDYYDTKDLPIADISEYYNKTDGFNYRDAMDRYQDVPIGVDEGMKEVNKLSKGFRSDIKPIKVTVGTNKEAYIFLPQYKKPVGTPKPKRKVDLAQLVDGITPSSNALPGTRKSPNVDVNKVITTPYYRTYRKADGSQGTQYYPTYESFQEGTKNLPYLNQQVAGDKSSARMTSYEQGGAVSRLGYSDNSPYRNAPYLDINTPNGLIDMRHTSKDLIGIDENGKRIQMKANNPEMYQFSGTQVREIPHMQKGGRAPIYTQDRRDPRLRAYNDSLALHNFGVRAKSIMDKEQVDKAGRIAAEYDLPDRASRDKHRGMGDLDYPLPGFDSHFQIITPETYYDSFTGKTLSKQGLKKVPLGQYPDDMKFDEKDQYAFTDFPLDFNLYRNKPAVWESSYGNLKKEQHTKTVNGKLVEDSGWKVTEDTRKVRSDDILNAANRYYATPNYKRPVQPVIYGKEPTPKRVNPLISVQPFDMNNINPQISNRTSPNTRYSNEPIKTNYSFAYRRPDGSQGVQYFPNHASWQDFMKDKTYTSQTVNADKSQASASGYYQPGGIVDPSKKPLTEQEKAAVLSYMNAQPKQTSNPVLTNTGRFGTTTTGGGRTRTGTAPDMSNILVATNTRDYMQGQREAKYADAWKAEAAERERQKQERAAAVATRTDTNVPFTFPTGETKKWSDMNMREKFYVSGKNLGSMQSDDPTAFLNPLEWVGDAFGGMLENAGTMAYEAKQQNSILPYAKGILNPIAAGAMASIGTGGNTFKWGNNLVNPFADVDVKSIWKRLTKRGTSGMSNVTDIPGITDLAEVPEFPVQEVGPGRTIETTRGPINWWEEDNFRKANPNATQADIDRHFGSGSTSKPLLPLPKEGEPQLRTIPWKMSNLPGLHLPSTTEGGAVSKIVEARTGLVNVEQALGIIAKESGGKEKVELVRQALGDNVPLKMDYNDFREKIQDALIPLETNIATHRSNYGLNNLGYPAPKRESYDLAIGSSDLRIKQLNDNKLDAANIDEVVKRGKTVYEVRGGFGTYETREAALAGQKKAMAEIEKDMEEVVRRRAQSVEEMGKLPLENKTLLLSNESKLGVGSIAHHNPESTLGHVHFLRDPESPDILTVTQLQSDAFQQPKFLSKKEQFELTERMDAQLANLEKQTANAKVLPDGDLEFFDGTIMSKEEADNALATQKRWTDMAKAGYTGYDQKRLLNKQHISRFLQEIVDYSGKRGDINGIRLPTTETAAKVQNYQVKHQWNQQPEMGDMITMQDGSKGKVIDDMFINSVTVDVNGVNHHIDFSDPGYGHWDGHKPVLEINGKPLEIKKGAYEPHEHTILKKYAENPKLVKKLFNLDTKIVTDSKGNTWHQFILPEAAKTGNLELKAFKEGGLVMDNQFMKSGGWIKKAVNPKHKGYCTPMTKSTCTPRRKALARTFKKHHGFHEEGGLVNNYNMKNPIEDLMYEDVQAPEYMQYGGETQPMQQEEAPQQEAPVEQGQEQQGPQRTLINIEKGELLIDPTDPSLEPVRKYDNPNRYSSHNKNPQREPIGNFTMVEEGMVVIPKEYAERFEYGDLLTRRSIVAEILKNQANNPEQNAPRTGNGGAPFAQPGMLVEDELIDPYTGKPFVPAATMPAVNNTLQRGVMTKPKPRYNINQEYLPEYDVEVPPAIKKPVYPAAPGYTPNQQFTPADSYTPPPYTPPSAQIQNKMDTELYPGQKYWDVPMTERGKLSDVDRLLGRTSPAGQPSQLIQDAANEVGAQGRRENAKTVVPGSKPNWSLIASRAAGLLPTAYGITNALTGDPFLHYDENYGFNDAMAVAQSMETEPNLTGPMAQLNQGYGNLTRQLNNINSPSVRSEAGKVKKELLDATGNLAYQGSNLAQQLREKKRALIGNLKVQQGGNRLDMRQKLMEELRADSANRSNVVHQGLSEAATNTQLATADEERIRAINTMAKHYNLDPYSASLLIDQRNTMPDVIDSMTRAYSRIGRRTGEVLPAGFKRNAAGQIVGPDGTIVR